MITLRSTLFPSLLSSLAVALPILVSGCASKDAGPTRYDLSGKVTFNGAPVPAGEITLSPDSSKGNSGPGGIVMIENGEYKTPRGAGIVGGPYVVHILGFDGVPNKESEEGMPIFPPYETTVDFPREPTTHDFEIPGT